MTRPDAGDPDTDPDAVLPPEVLRALHAVLARARTAEPPPLDGLLADAFGMASRAVDTAALLPVGADREPVRGAAG